MIEKSKLSLQKRISKKKKKIKLKKISFRFLSLEKNIDIKDEKIIDHWRRAKFYVLYYQFDHIQHIIINSKIYYEMGILQKLHSCIKKNSVIFFIDNYSIYYATMSNQK